MYQRQEIFNIIQNEEWQNEMLQLEERVSEKDEYVSISSFHHIILSKK
ncbi:hypothetical protein SAMN02745248_00457 [Hathewaya proteolytica DSM 3090]|uniref:Uncharacterized protein n=1 Tax=Hathewaya proteolytica DSM 3090 TaxID=1121331 RepID=A0A1M6KFX4_9CLOT|nr:hypothetical protein [Hathewaya proteolytica]SHJ57893.1 hypothetical protein SAMN02745248_00457 [Hathewaya proteolytica DSM 3090]